jgi:hypothetical protein
VASNETELTELPEEEDEPVAVLTDDDTWDAELRALVAVCEVLTELDQHARLRVMRWAAARFLPNYMVAQR